MGNFFFFGEWRKSLSSSILIVFRKAVSLNSSLFPSGMPKNLQKSIRIARASVKETKNQNVYLVSTTFPDDAFLLLLYFRCCDVRVCVRVLLPKSLLYYRIAVWEIFSVLAKRATGMIFLKSTEHTHTHTYK